MIAKGLRYQGQIVQKRVLIVQNFDKTEPGLVGEALEDAGIAIDLVAAHDGGTLPQSHESHHGIVVLGGAQNALDDEDSPWFPQLLDLMRGHAGASKPVLGICLGAQLLSRALGGRNHVGGYKEFAWNPVELTDAGAADPLFAGLPRRFPSFQWHDDHFDLPSAAVRLAQSTVAPNQAFRFGRAAYGMQFHFEADTALVRRWNTGFCDYLDEHHPDWLAAHESEEARHGAAADAAGHAIARAWARLV